MGVILLAAVEDVVVQAAALAASLAPAQSVIQRRMSVPTLPGSRAGHLQLLMLPPKQTNAS